MASQEYFIQQTYAWEVEAFPDKQDLKEFTTTTPALQEMLKVVLSAKIKTYKSIQHTGKGEKCSTRPRKL